MKTYAHQNGRIQLIAIQYLIFVMSLSISTVVAQVTDTMQIERGWNLISLPVKIGDVPISITFPNAVSDAFLYEDGYVHKDTVDNGVGFWLKFDSDETIILTGEAIHKDTVNVVEGWNMIGSLSIPIHKSLISTEPGGIIISDYFYYDTESGYESSDTLKPGLGYWMKVDQGGAIILLSWLSCPGTPTVEYAGKIYHTVQIGRQCWLRENLDVGVSIYSSWNAKDNGTIEKYCYDNDPANCNTYGGLYQWNEAMQYTTTPGTKGICPTGWHIPTLAEFQTLSDTVNGYGNALKAIGQGTGGGAGTNTSGFSALLAGIRGYYPSYFYRLSSYADFWSSTEYYSTYAYTMYLYNINSNLTLNYTLKGYGFSVRCLQDSVIPQNIHCPGTPSVDYEGKTYNTVQIGTKCWLKENLDVGTMILGTDTSKDNGIIEKYCYNDSIENCNTYGGLYQWNEAMQYTTTPGARGICPSGWHIPTIVEIAILSSTVGDDGTNTSGFSALLAGYRYLNGYFYGLSYDAVFWSSMEINSTSASNMLLYYDNSTIYLNHNYKDCGFSVRCLQD